MNALETVIADVRFATRAAVKKPGFTAAAVATLALGIGATSALFSVVDSVLLRPLPFAHADRLVAVGTTLPSGETTTGAVSYPDFADYRSGASSFDSLVALERNDFTLLTGGIAEKVPGARVSGGFFDALGVPMARGRSFGPNEDRGTGQRLAVLGHGLWQDRFGGDPAIVGRTITLDGNSYIVTGIAPAGFQFPWRIEEAQVFTPITAVDRDTLESRGMHYLRLVGRLGQGTSMAQAQADLKLLSDRLEKQYPDTNTKRWGFVVPLAEQVVGPSSRRGLWVLMGAVVCLLLLACANVANLTLARATEREREVAIRGALGADRSRLTRQLLTESVFLGVAGGTFGLLAAYGGVAALVSLAPADLPRLSEIHLDHRAVVFTFVVSIVTGILFGIAPSLRGSQVDLGKTLTESSRGVGAAGGHRRQRLRNAFIVAEVALALVLLTGAGLLIRSFDKVQRVDPGFDSRNVVTAQIRLNETRYTKPEQILAFHQRLVERLQSLPGITAAAIVNSLPFARGIYSVFIRDAGKPVPPLADQIDARYQAVTPGYFDALKQPLKRGRLFADSDVRGSHHVVVVSESLAARLFPGIDPLGHGVRFGLSMDDWDEDASWEVIGVVGDVSHGKLDQPPPAMFYVSGFQQPWLSPRIVVRSSADPMTLVGAIRSEVRALDPEVPVSDVKPLADLVAASNAERRFHSLLLGAFSATGLFLAAIGLYGVMSYSVNLRAREIGICMALGAARGRVLGDILRHGLVLTGIGVAIGLMASLSLGRTIESALFGVTASDPPTFGGAILVLMFAALLASYLPARRATTVDPMTTLRSE